MARFIKSRQILIPDVPPQVKQTTRQSLVIAGIGVFVIAAVLFVYLGA